MGVRGLLYYGLAVMGLLLCGQSIFSQEPGVVLADPTKIANLQLDLLAEKKKTLEARGDWLRAENKVWQSEIDAWAKSRAELQTNLDKTFGCSFDMDTRQCRPAEAKQQEKEKQP